MPAGIGCFTGFAFARFTRSVGDMIRRLEPSAAV
jgi:hypothetical protein